MKRIRRLTWICLIGLALSGVTAIPLRTEVGWLVKTSGADRLVESAGTAAPGWASWLMRVQEALQHAGDNYPFLLYGTDWLAFANFVIALAFVGALRDPIRNRWVFEFGLIACGLLVPYALIFGGIRGVPLWWRLIDCAFGVLGFIVLWYCRKWSRAIEFAALTRPKP